MWQFLRQSFGRHVWIWLAVLLAGLIVLFSPSPFSRGQEAPAGHNTGQKVYLLQIDAEMISAITAQYIEQGIATADKNQAEAVIIQLDTPGGLLTSTHTIVKTILNAPVPVIVYVAPAGARAGSAGVFITMASHVAAMAPSTRIGAAHPVDVGGNWPDENEGQRNKAQPGGNQKAMSQKILNDTVAGIRAIAKARGRNEAWAVRAVTESVSITEEEALKENVIDLVATDVTDLLRKADGRTVVVDGARQTLQLQSAQLVEYAFTPRQQFLAILTNPLLAYFLLMIGFYGLLFEVTHPGFGLPGIAGGICLILALIGMQAMSINMAGLGFIALGLALFIVEVFTPTFGALFLGGLVCLVLGTLFIYQTGEPYLLGMVPYIVTLSLIIGALTGLLLWKVFKIQRVKAKNPFEKLVGEVGIVVVPIEPNRTEGKVRVYGEIWTAVSDVQIAEQSRIVVTAVEEVGTIQLHVKPFVQED